MRETVAAREAVGHARGHVRSRRCARSVALRVRSVRSLAVHLGLRVLRRAERVHRQHDLRGSRCRGERDVPSAVHAQRRVSARGDGRRDSGVRHQRALRARVRPQPRNGVSDGDDVRCEQRDSVDGAVSVAVTAGQRAA
jgi:hypothetical protein